MRLPLFLLLCLLLTGCLTSKEPFYLKEQVFQDSKFEGFYPNKEYESSVRVKVSMDFAGSYDVMIQDGNSVSVSLIGTLFKLDGVTYLDLYPNRDSGVRRVPGGPPTLSEAIRYGMYQKLHLIYRVELADDNLLVSAPSKKGVQEAIRSGKVKSIGDTIQFDEPTGDIQAILKTLFQSEGFFDQPNRMEKKKET